MIFSERKSESLRCHKELKASTFLISIAIASAFFVPYIIMGKGYFIFYGDFNVQQIPFYKMCHAAVKSGNFKWSFTTDLGANFIGSYSFYLITSPFFWITIPFSTDFVPYLMGPLLILKFGLAALTAYVYIRRFTRTPAAARLGAILYAFSGFSVYNIFFNHFHEAIIVFPLLLLAMEYLITENRRGVFALAVTLAAVINYFFFFGMAVFCIIYYFVRVGMGAVKFKLSRFLWLVFEAVLGVLMASAVLIPSVLAIIGNSRVSNLLLGWNAVMYGKEQIYLNIIECFFFPPDLPARPVFFPSAEVKWSSLGGWLPLMGMTGVIGYMSARKKSWIRRLIVICIIFALVPILNSAFYAFNSAYYARWFYMPILIMSLATSRFAEEDDISFRRGFKWSASITAVFVAVIGLFPKKNEDNKITLGLFTNSEDPDYILRFWAWAAISLVSLALLALIFKISKKNRRRFIKLATVFVCIVSVCYANVFVYIGRSHSYDIQSVMIDSLIEGDIQLEGDRDTFRIDTFDCVDNTAMFLGYSSMNAFHSIVPASIMEFYKTVGITRDVGSRADTNYPALRSLFSVKYLLDRKSDKSFVDDNGNTLMPGYEYKKTAGGYYVYENKNYIGYGFSYDYAMTQGFYSSYEGNSLTRMMLKAMILTDGQMKKYSDYITNITVIRENHLDEMVYDGGRDKDGDISDDDSDDIDIDIDIDITNPDDKGKKPQPDNEKADTVTLDLTDDEMAADCARLNRTAAKSFRTDKNGFTATVERDKKSLVFFSVPYDEGWSATVNGKKVDVEKVNIGFMAVSVDAGKSTIRFDYETPGLFMGMIVTGCAFTVFLIYFIAASLIIRKRAENEIYPEGDELINMWIAAEQKKKEKHEGSEDTVYKSLLDGLENIDHTYLNEDMSGGFTVDNNIFKDE